MIRPIFFALLILLSGPQAKAQQAPPHPLEENPEIAEQVKRLWGKDTSTIQAAQKTSAQQQKEKVRQEWIRFSRHYPQNPFIPWEQLGLPQSPSSVDPLPLDADQQNLQAHFELMDYSLWKNRILYKDKIDPLTQHNMENKLIDLYEALYLGYSF